VPIVPPAPGLFVIKNFTPVFLSTTAAKGLITISLPLPGGKGTVTSIGLLGCHANAEKLKPNKTQNKALLKLNT
jgi:hypothetical protein